MEITITEPECQLLIELLEGEIPELRSEGYHAESHAVKEMLKERQGRAKRLLEHLKQAVENTAPTG